MYKNQQNMTNMDRDDITAQWHLLAEGGFGKFIETLRHLPRNQGYYKSDLADEADVSNQLVYRGDLTTSQRQRSSESYASQTVYTT